MGTMPAELTRVEDALELDLSGCRGGEFSDTLAKIKEVPGARYDGKRKIWAMPENAHTAERVILAIQPEHSKEIAEWVKQEKTSKEAELVSQLPEDAEVLVPWGNKRMPWQPEEINGEPFTGLKAHQRALVAAVASDAEVRALICDDQGLGKTAQALSIIAECKIRSGREPGPKLIVCPNPVKGVWEREIKRWLGNDSPVFSVEGSTARARDLQLRDATNNNGWAIVNYEQLRTTKEKRKLKNGGTKTVEVMKQPLFASTPWQAAVADEIHRAKNRKAAQTRGLYKVRAEIMLGMSGTPIMNSPDDLWSLLHWLFPKEYTSYWRFYEQYVDYVEGYFGKDIIGVKNPDALRFELGDRLYRRTKDEVLDLPEKQRITVPVKLDKQARKLYDEAETKLWLELETAVQEGDKEAAEFTERASENPTTLYSIPNGAARTVRLRQILSTPALLGGEDHSNKMDTLVESIEDAKHKQHVVFSEFVSSCDILVDRLARRGINARAYTGETDQRDRATIEDEFQAGDIDVLVGTIGAMREGLTLTAADTVHFLERSWVPAWNHQAEDRLHRIGQKNHVTVYIYEAEETVDDGTIKITNNLKDRIVRTVLPQDQVKEK